MSSNNSNEIKIKIILLGDSSVGKTTILCNYIDNTYNEDVTPTVGLENRVKTIDIRGLKAKIQLWDIAGQEKYNSMTQQYFHNTDGILLVFDLTNKDSFSRIKKWLTEIKNNSDHHRVKKLLIGNKSDLKDKIKVSQDDIDNLINKEKGLKYLEVSAKMNTNVSKAFENLINSIVGKRTNEELIADLGINDQVLSMSGSTLVNITGESKKKCC